MGTRYPKQGLTFQILSHASRNVPPDSREARPPPQFDGIDEHQIQWAVEAGLAPLLCHYLAEEVNRLSPPFRDPLLGANLTAMVLHASRIAAVKEILKICEKRGIRATLLKGISVAEQVYPAAHLRPMSDIDVLVPASACDTVESALLQLGFTRMDYQQRAGSHHGAPLCHPRHHVWVEVHHALFSAESALSSAGLFQQAHVAAHSIPTTYHGHTVSRLCDELQLAYAASSWVQDLARHGIHASYVVQLLDAIFLIKATSQTLDWERLRGWVDHPSVAAALHVMLSYLARRRLCDLDAAILPSLAAKHDSVGPAALRIIHGMLDRYLLGGRSFSRLFSAWHAQIVLTTLLEPGSDIAKVLATPRNIAFPPSIAERYSLKYQLDRIARLTRGGS